MTHRNQSAGNCSEPPSADNRARIDLSAQWSVLDIDDILTVLVQK